jgi:transketolase
VYDKEPSYGLGEWPRLRTGGDITLIGHGLGVSLALAAADLLAGEHGIQADVLDAAYLRPFDADALIQSAGRTGRVLTIEDHSVVGGLGSLVAETLAARRLAAAVGSAALPAEDLEVGVPAELYEYYGLTATGVAAKALDLTRAS